MSELIETTLDRRERLAAALADVIDARGYAQFPRDRSGLTGEQVKLARRDLFQAIEDLADGGRDIELCDIDGGDGPATVVWWADDPPPDPE